MSQEKDYRLLMLSGALGIQFTGEAIGYSLLKLAVHFNQNHTVALLGSTLVVAADIVRSYIWWRVFQKVPALNPAPLRPRTLEE
jgi:hypothetical protein